MTCPYGTGRTFTNERLYRQHVRDWPAIARVNGLNLDGTNVGVEAPAEPPPELDAIEPEAEPEADGLLPEGFPGRDALIDAGITHTGDVATLDLETLLLIPGIGKSTATRILAASE